jgi:hypothetical protein
VSNPLVLGLDIATVTGWAYGRVDANAPQWGAVRFGSASTPSPKIFGEAMNWAIKLLHNLKPDIVMMEALLPPLAMRNQTSRAVRDRLCGLNAIIAACAHHEGVGEIASAQVQDIRAHFIGERMLPRKVAKQEVKDKCLSLGWSVPDDNCADAVACWSYACALIDPKLALRGSPLFSRIASMW